MKPFLKLPFLCLILLSFISCDPPHNIYLINQTDSKARIRIKVNPKAEQNELTSITNGDSIVFNLHAKDTAVIDFGIGVWDDNEIDMIANSIDNIEIETKDIRTNYKSKEAIADILKENQKGFWWKTKIEVEIK